MANPKMQEKKNKLLKNKKALKQKQKQEQKQIVTQNVHVHVNKSTNAKRRPRGNAKNVGYSAPIINVSVPTTMRNVPFEVTNSHENEANIRRAREQQQNQYTNLLNQNENIPIAMPIYDPNNNYNIPPSAPKPPPVPPTPPTPPPPRNPPPPFDPNHIDLSNFPNVPPTPKRKTNPSNKEFIQSFSEQMNSIQQQKEAERNINLKINKSYANAFSNVIVDKTLENMKAIQQQKEKERIEKEKITKEFAKSFATGIVNDSLQKMVTIKKDQEKMNAIEDEQERAYQGMMEKRHNENERDAWRGDPNRGEWWRGDEGASEHKEAEDLTDARTRVEPFQLETHPAKIQAEIERLRDLSPEQLSKACKSTNRKGDIYTIASNLGINPTRGGDRKPVDELRGKISNLIKKPIIEPKRGRPKKSVTLQIEEAA